MNLRQIRIFLTVVNSGCSISEAARKLMISQPSVSAVIHELEENYGVLLFDRFSRRLHLTEAGRRFEQYADRIVNTCDDLEKEMYSWGSEGILNAGASITAGSQFMPGYTESFTKQYPKIRLHVRIDHSRNLEEALMQNELDLAILETQMHNPMLEVIPFKEDTLEVIAPVSGLIPENKARLSPEEFCEQPFILREEGSGTREIFEQVMADHGKKIEPVWDANSTTAIIAAVSRGLGISVIPREAAKEDVEKGKIRIISVKGLHFLQRFYIVHHKDKVLMPYMEAFIENVLNEEA